DGAAGGQGAARHRPAGVCVGRPARRRSSVCVRHAERTGQAGRFGAAALRPGTEEAPRMGKVRMRPRATREAGRAARDDGRGKPKSGALEWAKSIAIAFGLFLLIRTFLVQTFTITSGSMEDTLLVGDFLMLSKAAYGAQIPGTSMRLP